MNVEPSLERLGKSTLLYGVSNVANRCLGALLLPVLTLYLSPEDYGISSILNWMVLFITPVFSLGISAGLGPCYFSQEDRVGRERVMGTAFTLLLGSAAMVALVGALSHEWLGSLLFPQGGHLYLVVLSVLCASFTMLQIPLALYLQFEHRAKDYLLLSLAATGCNVLLILCLVVFLRRGVQGLVEAGLITQILSLALFLWPMRKERPLGWDGRTAKELLRLGIPFVPSFGFLFILQHANRYLLQWLDGIESVGIYTIGFNIGLLMSLFVSAFSTAWLPFFMPFADRKKEAEELFGKILTYYTYGFGFLTGCFFSFAKPVVMLLTQPQFYDAYKSVGLTAYAYFFLGAFYVFLPGIYFTKELKFISVIQGLASLLSIGGSLALIPRFGILGAALSLTISHLGMASLIHVWNRIRRKRYPRIRYEWARPLSFLIILSGCNVISLLDLSLSLLQELAISLATVALLGFVVYLFLNEQERIRAMDAGRVLLKRALGRTV